MYRHYCNNGGGFAFQCMSTYRLSRIPGGDAYEESTKEGSRILFDIIDVVATIIHTMVSLVRLVYDIMNDREQKSNRPAKD